MRPNKINNLVIALEDLGTETVLQLLKKCKTPASRREYVKVLAITNIDLKKLVKTANLIGIEGIGEKEVEMLEAVGVVTLKDLSKMNVEILHNKLESYGEEKSISIPSKEELVKWIKQAKSLVQISEV